MDMAMAAIPQSSATRISSISYFHNPNYYQFIPKSTSHLHLTTTSYRRISLLVQASKPPIEEASSTAINGESSLSQDDDDDLTFLVKLGAGSVAGAAVIKYGSIVCPEITRPNIVEALFIITVPVVAAVALLIRQSRV